MRGYNARSSLYGSRCNVGIVRPNDAVRVHSRGSKMRDSPIHGSI
jgi:hypothetical protein